MPTTRILVRRGGTLYMMEVALEDSASERCVPLAAAASASRQKRASHLLQDVVPDLAGCDLLGKRGGRATGERAGGGGGGQRAGKRPRRCPLQKTSRQALHTLLTSQCSPIISPWPSPKARRKSDGEGIGGGAGSRGERRR